MRDLEDILKGVHFKCKPYVLVLPGWYSTWQDAYTGDFNQRQVWAAGLYMPQVVLYLVKSKTPALRSIEIRWQMQGENVLEIIVMYPVSRLALLQAVDSNYQFYVLLKKYSALIEKHLGKPVLLHAYIAIRGGIAARWLAEKWKLPYILTEHWTIYQPADPGFLMRRNKLFIAAVQWVYKKVSHVMPVSKSLYGNISKLMGEKPATVVANVVDTSLFYPEKSMVNDDFQFIHISTMSYQKNAEGLLRVFARVAKETSCKMLMVGPADDSIITYGERIGLHKEQLHFTGNITYSEVAPLLRNADALVLFSRYENLPCVVLEALCCGIPVISTDVGGVAEVIDASNGLLVTSEDEGALENAMRTMLSDLPKYNKSAIAEKATAMFGYPAIGKKIYEVYAHVCKVISRSATDQLPDDMCRN